MVLDLSHVRLLPYPLRDMSRCLIRNGWLRPEEEGSPRAEWLASLTGTLPPPPSIFEHPRARGNPDRPQDLLTLAVAADRSLRTGCGTEPLQAFLEAGAPLRALSVFLAYDRDFLTRLGDVGELVKRHIPARIFADVLEGLCLGRFTLEDLDRAGRVKNPSNLAAVAWFKAHEDIAREISQDGLLVESRIKLFYRFVNDLAFRHSLGALMAFGGMSRDEIIMLFRRGLHDGHYVQSYEGFRDGTSSRLKGTPLQRLEAALKASKAAFQPHSRGEIFHLHDPGPLLRGWLRATGEDFFEADYYATRSRHIQHIQIVPSAREIERMSPGAALCMNQVELAEACLSVGERGVDVSCLQRDTWHLMNEPALKRHLQGSPLLLLDLAVREAAATPSLEAVFVPSANRILRDCALPANPNKIAADYGLFLPLSGFHLYEAPWEWIGWCLPINAP